MLRLMRRGARLLSPLVSISSQQKQKNILLFSRTDGLASEFEEEKDHAHSLRLFAPCAASLVARGRGVATLCLQSAVRSRARWRWAGLRGKRRRRRRRATGQQLSVCSKAGSSISDHEIVNSQPILTSPSFFTKNKLVH